MNIFVMGGVIEDGRRGIWNMTSWVYNVLTEKWTFLYE